MGMGSRRARRLCVITMLLAGLSAVPPASANDGSVAGTGGSLYMIDEVDVSMRSERIEVTCFNGYAVYTCEFNFVNETSADKPTRFGFPFPWYDSEEYQRPSAVRAWLNGEPLAITPEDGKDGETPVKFFVHEATLPPGESQVTVQYIGTPGYGFLDVPAGAKKPPGATNDLLGVSAFPYDVHTGAGWAGPIGETVIQYTLAEEFSGSSIEYVLEAIAARRDDVDAAKLLRSYAKPGDRIYEWVYRDYEPTVGHDVVLPFLHSGEPPLPGRASACIPGLPDENVGRNVPPREGSTSAETVFGRTLAIQEVRFLPGMATSYDEFFENGRPKRVRLDFSDGTNSEITLRDEPAMQVFPVSASAISAKATILESYPGEKASAPVYLGTVEFSERTTPKELWEPFGGIGSAPRPQKASSSEVSTATMGVASQQSATSKRSVASQEAADESGSSANVWLIVGGVVLVIGGGIVAFMTARGKGALASARNASDGLVLRGPAGTHMLGHGVITIGSGPRSDIVLEDPTVSVMHAVIKTDGDGVRLRSTSQSSLVTVNGESVVESPLAIGDRVAFGEVEFMVTPRDLPV